jgi:Mn-dependent DtxR family transcriptional regulator
MPISIDAFEGDARPGGPSVPERVVGFLVNHDDHAFTRSEIAAAVGADPNTVGTALTRLKDRSLVRHRGEYWAITDDRERLEAAYDLHAASDRLDANDGGIEPDAWDEQAPDQPHPSVRD